MSAPSHRVLFASGTSRSSPAALAVLLRRLMLSLLLAVLTPVAFAAAGGASDAAPLQFRDRAEEQRFHTLASELRCVMCQNQSLADSNAQIAHDLRREVLALMREGRTDEEIREFLVARYGEFVLYRPKMSAKTWLLWLGPLLLAFGGGIAIVRIARKRASALASSGTDRLGPPPEQDI